MPWPSIGRDVCWPGLETVAMFSPSQARISSSICLRPAHRRSRRLPKLRRADFMVHQQPRQIILFGRVAEAEGTYESDVFDAKVFSRWGRAEFRGAGNVELFARSGNVDNPDRNWSPWKPVELQKDPVLNVRRRVSCNGRLCCTRRNRPQRG